METPRHSHTVSFLRARHLRSAELRHFRAPWFQRLVLSKMGVDQRRFGISFPKTIRNSTSWWVQLLQKLCFTFYAWDDDASGCFFFGGGLLSQPVTSTMIFPRVDGRWQVLQLQHSTSSACRLRPSEYLGNTGNSAMMFGLLPIVMGVKLIANSCSWGW